MEQFISGGSKSYRFVFVLPGRAELALLRVFTDDYGADMLYAARALLSVRGTKL